MQHAIERMQENVRDIELLILKLDRMLAQRQEIIHRLLQEANRAYDRIDIIDDSE